MTSSLVGSEMCIRDRGARPSSGQARCRARTELPHHRCTHAPEVEGGGTVSYTHLTLPTICSV
eukprot:4025641-Prorocentrum_lima.AAC.1